LESLERLRETHDLSSIADDSVTFKQFQDLIESSYLSRSAELPRRRASGHA
jgi:hypothetical protein